MTGRTAGEYPPYCAYCATGNHAQCHQGDHGCACAARDHDPDVDTAAQMRLYQAPNLARAGIPVEQLATQYRQRSA